MWFWRALKLFFSSQWASFQYVYAVYFMRRLQTPIVTIFGGKRAAADSFYVQQTHELARRLALSKISVLTGGGPGIMEAANCGVYDALQTKKIASRYTLGIGVRDVNGEFTSRCTRVVTMSYFYMRKWLLMRYSEAFIFFPGGIGTADELFELLNLMKLQKLPTKPVVLCGAAYWQPLLHWFYDHVLAQGFIPESCRHMILVTDDLDKIVSIIHETCGTEIKKKSE
jgi:uncharacterized protein (TIGR00730 family)